MKKVLTTLSVLALLPSLVAFAAYDSVQLNSGSSLVVTVGGSALNLTVSDGRVEDLQVHPASITATLANGSHLDISSSDRKSFTYSVGGAVSSFSCGSSSSQLSISNNSATSQSITVTPTSGTCQTESQTGGAGGGGGGGGGGGDASPAPAPAPAPSPEPSPAPVPAPVPTPAVVPTPVPATTVAAPSVVAQLVSPVFNTLIQQGSKGDDVKRLQELLSQDKDIYPEGSVTGYFGPLTRAAVRKFQLKYGVIKNATDPGNGTLGPKTRAKLKEIFGSGSIPAAAPAVAPATTPAAASDQSDKLQQLNQLMQMLKQLQDLQAKLKP